MVGDRTKNQGRVCEPATPAAEQGVPLVVTASDVSTLLVGGSGLVRQPPGDQVIVTKDLIVHTDPSPRTLATTLAGTPVTVTATPTSYTWSWGDATSTTTTDPGQPYPHQTVTHRYQKRDKDVIVSLTTTWSATYTLADDTTAHPVTGTITTTETSTPFNLIRLTSVLTDDAEHAQGH
ncbi:zinc transporter [Actinomyces sp. AC-20-1]|uniref:zinc transporter n=1 Tax=Actinomyces sp. AC-20-1 TaxID=2761167 RepID=UPI002017BCF2|nr:zinc transporter [Actinomyces sp. AC-20-1]MCL3777308.1 zinc transporter [Actinomyces sp. AC-20-1]